jgi:energy-converting hydrogenase A subunit M
MELENDVPKTFSIFHAQSSISSLRFPHSNIESLRAKSIEREADNAVDQAILFIQQRSRELDAVAWRSELVWP